MSDGQVSQRRIIPFTTNTTIDLGDYKKKKIGIILDSSEDEVRFPIKPNLSPRIKINNDDDTEFLLGTTGIYELDLNGLSEITAIEFDRQSVNMIATNSNGYLIVDILYEDGEN